MSDLDRDDDTLDDEGGVDIDYYPDALLLEKVREMLGDDVASEMADLMGGDQDAPPQEGAEYSRGAPCKQGESATRTGCIPKAETAAEVRTQRQVERGAAVEAARPGARVRETKHEPTPEYSGVDPSEVERIKSDPDYVPSWWPGDGSEGKSLSELTEGQRKLYDEYQAEQGRGPARKAISALGGALSKARALLEGAADKLPGWKQAKLERALAGTGLFEPDEVKSVVQDAMNQETRPRAVAAMRAMGAVVSALGKIAHASYALPIAARKTAELAGWSPKVAKLATAISANVDWVTHGAASSAVILAALGTMAARPRRTARQAAAGVRAAIESRGGLKVAQAALAARAERRARVRAARVAEEGA